MIQRNICGLVQRLGEGTLATSGTPDYNNLFHIFLATSSLSDASNYLYYTAEANKVQSAAQTKQKRPSQDGL